MTYVLRKYGIDIAIVSYRPLEGYKLWIAMSGKETGSNSKLFNRMMVNSDRPVGSDRY
ncbi:hypothetical protein [uncultured Nostoc sp.]|uniref:hypothetical protein n=1 Tax=uncultured Nostoc sp. TaxID=340711 RepID=UPI0035C986DA